MSMVGWSSDQARTQRLQHADTRCAGKQVRRSGWHHREAAPAHALVEADCFQPAQIGIARQGSLAVSFDHDEARVHQHVGRVIEATEYVPVPVAHLRLPFPSVRGAGVSRYASEVKTCGPSTSCNATKGAAAVWMHSKRWLA